MTDLRDVTNHGYQRGCRCDSCRAAHRERMRRQREARRSLPANAIPHGPYGYTNYACRCPVCRAANTAQCRRRRQARLAREPS